MSAAITALLPPLDQRLRGPEIEALCARVGSPVSPEGLDRFLAGVDAEIEAWERDFAQVEAAVARGEPDAIAGWLRAHSPPERLAGDLAAVRRHLDLDVVRERTLRAIERVGILEELALRARAQLPPLAGASLCARLAHSRRWASRLAAVEGLLDRDPPLDASDLSVIHARAEASGEHPWVRAGCERLIARRNPDKGLARLRRALAPLTTPRHFLLRRLLVDVVVELSQDRPAAAAALLGPVCQDPSEHVRLGLAQDLWMLPSAVALALAGPLARDPSPRVRLGLVVGAQRAPAWPESLPLLRAVLLDPLQTPLLAGEAARALVDLAARRVDLAAAAQEALDEALRLDRPPPLREPVATARLLGRVTALDGWRQQLRARIAAIPPGGRAWIPWPAGTGEAPDDAAVGELLAALSADDHGLWARRRPGGLWVWRGDQARPRLWRLLHELRSPAPNKRQDHPHYLGRVIRGSLRAPPGRLAEVTATTVPGERVVSDREGSWGRHLPSVDDVLSLPAGASAQIFHSFGVTSLQAPPGRARALWRGLRLVVDYRRLARLRSRALQSAEPEEQAAFREALRQDYGLTMHFQPSPPGPAPTGLSGHAFAGLPAVGELLRAIAAYAGTPASTAQPALSLFAAGALGVLLGRAWQRRQAVADARARIPLCVGGWGTRGKSGTERIKAGLFHGLGHQVVVKTTGCEAMFIPAFPGQAAREIFLYRPYDKSTIWEQSRVLRLAAELGARVFLWECMALRPRYVELLERTWMRDDLCTLTNAFPDHEDIQGPTGAEVARTITSFVPDDGVALTTEHEFLPFFRDVAAARGSELEAVTPVQAELIGADLLALFPYQEHPRNIALVARMAERLGVPRDLAILTMAEHVVPDLGVLRAYPSAVVLGRELRFLNGMSANERTGCVNNWRRTGCDRVPIAPGSAVITVVNNRQDRVARSEVFARILVEDLSADAHVLIGTNLRGLLRYVEDALQATLGGVALLLPEDGVDRRRAGERLAGWMARLRVPAPSVERFFAAGEVWAAGAGLCWAPDEGLRAAVDRWLSVGGALDPGEVSSELQADAALCSALRAALRPGGRPPQGPPEVLAPPPAEEVVEALLGLLGRLVVYARLAGQVADPAQPAATVNQRFRAVWAAMFRRTLRLVEDPAATGDQIVVACARAVPPGVQATVMGIQNIKGAGLDFVYRWVAHGAVDGLLASARSADADERLRGLRALLAFDDHGLLDAATAAARLADPPPGESPAEAEIRQAVARRTAALAAGRRAALGEARARGAGARVLDRLEGLLDWLDSARRTFAARRIQRALVAHHISLARAAEEMHALTSRQKGGWLAAWVASWRTRASEAPPRPAD